MNKSLTIRLEKSLLDKYKSHCDKNGYDMSKRLRLFIESEIKNDNEGHNNTDYKLKV